MFSEHYIIRHLKDQGRDRQRERSQAKKTVIDFIHSSFNKLFFLYLICVSVLGTRDTATNKTSKVLILMEGNSNKEKTHSGEEYLMLWRYVHILTSYKCYV